MTPKELKALCGIMRKNGVQSLRAGDVEIVLSQVLPQVSQILPQVSKTEPEKTNPNILTKEELERIVKQASVSQSDIWRYSSD